MKTAIELGGIIAACAVLIGCVVRVDLLRAGEHRVSVFGVYLLWAVFAFGVVLGLLRGEELDWYDVAALAGMLMHLALSRKSWRGCAPRDAQVKQVRDIGGQHG